MSLVMAVHLHRLNKKQQRRRTAAGCTGKLVDTSILTLEDAAKANRMRSSEKGETEVSADFESKDMTDMENMFFHYASVSLWPCDVFPGMLILPSL